MVPEVRNPKVKVLVELHCFWKLWTKVHVCLFHLLKSTCLLWHILHIQSQQCSIFKSLSDSDLCFLSSHTLISPSFKDPCDYTGPTQVVQNNLISRSLAKSQPFRITYSQFPGSRTPTSLGIIIQLSIACPLPTPLPKTHILPAWKTPNPQIPQRLNLF